MDNAQDANGDFFFSLSFYFALFTQQNFRQDLSQTLPILRRHRVRNFYAKLEASKASHVWALNLFTILLEHEFAENARGKNIRVVVFG